MGQNRKFENRVSREFIFSIEDETLKSFFHFTYSTWKNFTRNWGRWRERERERERKQVLEREWNKRMKKRENESLRKERVTEKENEGKRDQEKERLRKLKI